MRRRVAITGLGCVTPLGCGAAAFREGLRTGRSGVRRISLFDPSELPVRIAAEAVGFDPADHVPPKDARHVARVVPMAIAAAAEALGSAGIDAGALTLAERRRIAVLVGSGGGPVEFFEKMYGHWYRGELKKASVYAIPTGTIGTLSSELSMRFGLKGPSHVVSTGCTSSADAIGYAAKAIRYGERDVVLAGGADAVITPGIMTGFGLMQILASSRQDAPETASRPFDAGRDGFVLGEGAWFFVLEEMERARARGVPLLGEVVGYAATCDAWHRVRLDESGEEPARAMTEALEDAGLSPADVGYVQYHGTGTELNDRIETRATKIALGDAARTVPGSSVKSQVGHPQGASGAAGLAATLLALNDGFLPPTVNLDAADPECDLDYVPRAARPAEVGVALVNGIAFGSKNTALVVRTARAPGS
ncbi:MAG: beta-ketoacyl-[acyl-carrier-protein] synthase family protein [Thermoanaerobaculia bacterium]